LPATPTASPAASTARRAVEVVEQYIGGAVGRAAEIEAGATRSLAALIADVASSARRLQAAALAMRDDAWDRPTLAVGGEIQPAWVLIRRRWREVEVHHVDLGLGYEPRDWPAAFVETCLPELLAALPARLDAHEFVAWAFDRGAAPSLRSYG
jgi:maleylpyruvate isomerase